MKVVSWLFLLPLVSAQVLTLTSENFAEQTAEKAIFIKFFTPEVRATTDGSRRPSRVFYYVCGHLVAESRSVSLLNV
jgi:hypothetical protein